MLDRKGLSNPGRYVYGVGGKYDQLGFDGSGLGGRGLLATPDIKALGYRVWSRPTRWTRSTKRGSPRTGSKKGCTLRNCRMLDCS